MSLLRLELIMLHCRLNLLSQAQQICMTFLFQLVSIAEVSSPRQYWYRDIWYRDISWYCQYRPTLLPTYRPLDPSRETLSSSPVISYMVDHAPDLFVVTNLLVIHQTCLM